MEGVGHSTAAITIVNALFTGVGSAVGIDLKVDASIELDPAASDRDRSFQVDSSQDSPLVRRSTEAALHFFEPRRAFRTSLRLHSEIPPRRGLKSSSAVSTAIVRAVATALGREIDPTETARLAANVAQEIGLSATGAFDDALAGLLPGFVVTDNRTRRTLRLEEVDPRWTSVLWIPPGDHRPSIELASQFLDRSSDARAATKAVSAGRFLPAMEQNTALVEQIMGYEYAPLRAALRGAGAIASGVSGMGPSLAVIAPHEVAPKLLRLLPAGPGDRRIVPFSRSSGPEGPHP